MSSAAKCRTIALCWKITTENFYMTHFLPATNKLNAETESYFMYLVRALELISFCCLAKFKV